MKYKFKQLQYWLGAIISSMFINSLQANEPLDPSIERVDTKVADIDNENFEVGIMAGVINIENFGTQTLFGGRLAYHITEDFFLETTYFQTEAEETSFERISQITLLTESERDYEHYDFNIGWNILPGETFFGDKYALNSAFYLVVGTGRTDFGGNAELSITFGAGYRLLVTDWLAWHLDFRDYVFDSEILGESETMQNLSFSTGFTVFY